MNIEAAMLPSNIKSAIEEVYATGVPIAEELKDILQMSINCPDDAGYVWFKAHEHLRKLAVIANSGNAMVPDEPVVQKYPVTLRAALKRINRKLSPWSKVCISRKRGEKEIGRFLVVESNCIRDGFETVERLADYAREVGALGEYEFITNT
jgi:hypothetical protein